MESKLLFSCVAVLLMFFVNQGTGLKCHQCSSKTDPDCDDPFYYEEDNPGVVTTQKYLAECPADDGNEYTLCRKIIQNVHGESRVNRSCGWEKEETRDCYLTVLELEYAFVCQCFEDGCNSASMFSLSLAGIVSTITLTYFLN